MALVHRQLEAVPSGDKCTARLGSVAALERTEEGPSGEMGPTKWCLGLATTGILLATREHIPKSQSSKPEQFVSVALK